MKTLVVALLWGFCFAHARAASAVSVVVRPHSFVKGETLTLGDIADFTGFTKGEMQNLKKIALGNAPAFGEKRNYTNQALAEILRVSLKKIQDKNGKQIKLQIPEEVAVEGNGLTFTKAGLVQTLTDRLKKICETCDYKIEDLRLPAIPTFAPQSTWELRADERRLKGPFNISLEVVNPGGEKSTFWITGRVSIWKKVPVTTHVLSINDRVEADDVKWATRDVTFLYDTPPEENELLGQQVKMSLAPDQIIVRGNLVRKRALSRGDTITLTSSGSAWNISVKGIAQENGYVGDTVRVLNPDTKKIVSGLVVDQGIVEVK